MSHTPALNPSMSFDEACDAVVAYLADHVPMGYWSVSRFDGTNQLYLALRDTVYGKVVGDHHPWADSLCRYSVTGEAPSIAPDAMAVALYAEAPISKVLDIGSYIGIPVRRADGELFATICGVDPEIKGADLAEHAPFLDLLATLLGAILEADLSRADQARKLEQAEARAETDHLTGVVNRRGWDRYVALEEERYRRFGDPGAVIVLDLDGMKLVNDTEGHAAGDRYLKLAARTISAAVRPDDIVARVGGDEFAILATNIGPRQTLDLARRLRAALREAGVSMSVGYAPYTFVAGFPGAWQEADAAMYDDKRRRRNLSLARH